MCSSPMRRQPAWATAATWCMQGFPGLNVLASRLTPAVLLHGHVDPDPVGPRDHWLGATLVRNVTGWQLFDLDPATGQVSDVAPHPHAGYGHAC